MPASRYGMDDLAAQFVDVLWEEGESRSLAGDFLSGLSHHLPVRGLLPRAWKLFSAWQRHEMPSRATPFTLDILLAMVGAGLRLGLGHNFVTTLLVAFHCLLRTGEAMSILGRDIRFAADRSHAWISLGFTKGGKRRGVEEYVKVYDPWTVQMLLLASEELREGDKLLQLTPLQFRKAFSDCLKLLKLDRLEFRPYSLRRGGATFLFRHCGEFDVVAERGRWANSSTARIYINDALAQVALLDLTGPQRSGVESCKQLALSLFE